MAKIEQPVRPNAIAADVDSMARALNREVLPLLRELRAELRRLSGEYQVANEASVTVGTATGVLVQSYAGASTVTLPSAQDVPEKWLTLIRKNLFDMDVVNPDGGTIGIWSSPYTLTGSSTYQTLRLYSTGEEWLIVSVELLA